MPGLSRLIRSAPEDGGDGYAAVVDDTLRQFLQELHDQTVLHADDLADTVERAANGDPEARSRVTNGKA